MFKQWRIASMLLLAAVMGVFISACGSTTTTTGSTSSATSTPSTLGTPGTYTCLSGSLTLAGSTALAPLTQQVAKDYQAQCSSANVSVGLGGSGVGLADAENGTVQIGDSDIFSKAGQSDLVDHQVAIIVFTLVINKNVTGVTNLTTDQIKSIYSGKVTNWNQLGGPNLKITVVSRPTTSGTRATFGQYILAGPETITGPSNLISDSTGTVATEVNQTSGAIGYVTTGAAKNLGLTMLNIDGNSPTASSVESNTYKFWNIEHMYTKGAATGLALAFLDYMSSTQAVTDAHNLGYLALTEMQASAIQAHQPQS